MVKRTFVLTVGVCGAVAATSTGCGSLDRSLRSYEATARPAGVAAKLNALSADINRGYEATGAPRSTISTKPVENAGCGGMWRSVTGDRYTDASPYSLDVQLQVWISPRSRLRPVLVQLRQHLEQVGWTVTDDETAPPPSSKAAAWYRPLRLRPKPDGYRGWVEVKEERGRYLLTTTIMAPCLKHPDEK